MDIKDLTLAGWLLLIVTVAGAFGIGLPVMNMLSDSLPEGRYPRILFMAPTVVIGVIIFFGGSKVLKAIGMSVMKSDDG